MDFASQPVMNTFTMVESIRHESTEPISEAMAPPE